MNNYFKDWFSVNYTANRDLAEIIVNQKSGNAKIYSIFSHILYAHEIWLDRMFKKESTTDPWSTLSIHDWHSKNSSNLNKTRICLSSEDWDRIVLYKNTSGQEYQNSYSEILFHVLTHSAYHRGQIALLLRQKGESPPLTDFISYKRKEETIKQPKLWSIKKTSLNF